MDNKFTIRLIDKYDTAAALGIYKPYVENTAITFDYDTPSIAGFSEKIDTITAEYPWLVCMHGDEMAGYAYASRHRAKTAYQWSPESTIYLAPEFYGKGIAKALYSTLFSLLRLQGYFNVYAGVTIPNEKSERFHKAMGFEELGIFTKIGFKLGRWHDTKWLQLHLAEHIDNPALPAPIAEVRNTDEFNKIMEEANRLLNTE